MKGKKVSNYELFFDLVFVLATSGVVGILHSTPEHIVSFERILSFVVSTLSIWYVCLFETVLEFSTFSGTNAINYDFNSGRTSYCYY